MLPGTRRERPALPNPRVAIGCRTVEISINPEWEPGHGMLFG
jgi:hypothetical protein